MVLLESVLYKKVKKGAVAPGFSLKCIDGRSYTLEQFAGKPVLVVFMCNHCPYVVHKIPVIVALDKEFPDLQVVGINANDPCQCPEDSLEGMKTFAKEMGIEFPYLVDETQDVARSWGATCTPDPFLLDSRLRLVYRGRFDDALDPGSTPTTAEMKEAVQQLMDGNLPTVREKLSRGCSIKWKQ